MQLAQMLKQKTAVATPALRVDEQAAVLSAENLSDFVKRLAQITNFTAQLQKLVGADNPVFEPVRPLLKAISELSRACNASMQDAMCNIHRPRVACRAAATVAQPRGGLSWDLAPLQCDACPRSAPKPRASVTAADHQQLDELHKKIRYWYDDGKIKKIVEQLQQQKKVPAVNCRHRCTFCVACGRPSLTRSSDATGMQACVCRRNRARPRTLCYA